jgi:hypothetical protein
MKHLLSIFFALLLVATAPAQVTLDYYLPDGVTYNADIPTPKEILGQEVGEWHVRHDQLVDYMHAIAEASDRAVIVETGRSYENRQLLSLLFTSPANHARLEEIRLNHLKLGNPEVSADMDVSSMPVVVQLSYSVHGNEPSGSNSSLLTAYHLAAAQGAEIDELLANAVVLVDPSINPDGLARFAHWANMHKSKKTLVTDPESREYNEVWPGGRTNHYWFDLNRDWMLVQHPESKGRVARFQEWKPNILTDHHEMGTNSTFFFQPGIPSRTHPLTPERNQALTANIAEYHAEELDKIQSLYYSKESFDDYYYGKGSTYPDVQGSIGILFEQASSRGHAQESIHGILTFPFTIKNQFTATQSTLKAALGLRTELLEHYRLFYQEAVQQAERSSIKAYVFGESADQSRTYHLAEMLHQHKIAVYELGESVSANGESFEAGKAYVVPTNQPQYKLITALFERRNTFTDSLFYDVSAWTMPYAFNLPFAELNNRAFENSLLGEPFLGLMKSNGEVVGNKSNYAYVFEWDEYYAPRALYRLLDAGVKAKVSGLPFSGVTQRGEKNFDYGSILIPLGIQDDQDEVHQLIRKIASEDNLKVYALNTGLSSSGIDLGSNNFSNLTKPSVAVIGGEGTNAYEIGEMWHLMDQRYHMPLSIIDKNDVSGADLSRYTVLIMTGYNYSDLSGRTVDAIKEWVREGGVLLAMKQGIYWASQQELADVEFVSREEEEDEETETRPYVKQGADQGAQVIGGTIFNAKLDLTHPLGYGYNDENITVFRNSTIFLEKGENPYSTPLYYTNSPLASGYVSDENAETMAGTASVIISRFGSGKVIAMTDNPNFRAFWYGTNKLFANSIFFGPTIRSSSGN